jgi:hypothetical protein
MPGQGETDCGRPKQGKGKSEDYVFELINRCVDWVIDKHEHA